MNISYNLLKDLIDFDLSPDETAKALTRVGLAVEGVHTVGGDFVLDIDLTSNRPDCLSHLGVARELSISLDRELKLRPVEAEMPMPPVLAGDVVRVDASDLCHRFTARIIRGVKVGPSPQWLVERLESIGERSINNVADITNYVMHELGQPMHSFDLDKLSGNRIVVRRAADGEKITTLDEVERELDSSMLMICDAEKPVAVAGVMGGIESGISDETTNVLLEVAYFDRASIRATSRNLGLATEASYRFERGVDIDNLKRASDRAVELICELAGGEKGEFIDIYPTHQTATIVVSNDISASVKRLTGLNVDEVECDRILTRLGIARQPDSNEYKSPSWRHDIAIEEDLVEEVARHFGYENIESELPPAYGAGEYLPSEDRIRSVRSALSALGFSEAMTYSFIDVEHDDKFDLVTVQDSNSGFVTLKDAVIEGAVRMRPTMLPGLLDAVRLNLNYQRRNLKLFEIGKAFIGGGNGQLPSEPRLLTIVLTGSEVLASTVADGRGLDLFDAKAAIETVASTLGISTPEFRSSAAKHLTAGRSAEVYVDGVLTGTVGRLHDSIASNYKLKRDVFVGELLLDVLLSASPESVVYKPLPRFPGVSRDVTFAVDRNFQYSSLAAAATTDDTLFDGSKLVGTFERDGERTITIRLNYRSDDRTLTDNEVEAVHNTVLANIQHSLGLSPKA